MLETLGLDSQAEAVYRAMLAHPELGVADLAESTGLPPAAVRAALNDLADLALLRPSTGSDGRLRPVSPDVGLATLLAAAEAEAAAKQAQLEATRAAIAAIAAEHDRRRDDGDTSATRRLVGLDAVRDRLAQLQLRTESECLSLNPGTAHTPDARDAAKPVNQQALERGVAIRAICRESVRNDPDAFAYARWLTGLGGQMRTVPTVPMPLVIIDRRLAILPIDPSAPGDGALEVDSPGMIAAVCALFDQLWSVGSPFGEAAPTDRYGCTPQEQALLEIIAAGHTDDVAARKLGLSLRTVRRMMASLMLRLNASSRFQAGLNAARLGWI
ncbi:helix-turn-helix transcriptional regulator [Kitasatospora sp. NPDC002227]|uniref:helix-turn-helix transcriptional regulator n=1 Tax=Kitasatospora sp. NPDC002227 TaxID=3154773 RepID=UPI003334A0C0